MPQATVDIVVAGAEIVCLKCILVETGHDSSEALNLLGASQICRDLNAAAGHILIAISQ
jgi:disulfide oxidoreductase YuzD